LTLVTASGARSTSTIRGSIAMKRLPRYFLELDEQEARTLVQALAGSGSEQAATLGRRLSRAMQYRAAADANAEAGRGVADDPAPLSRDES
jgi:hypothetical protein